MGRSVILSSLGYYLLSSIMQFLSSLLLLFVLVVHNQAAPSLGGSKGKRMAGDEMAAPPPSYDDKFLGVDLGDRNFDKHQVTFGSFKGKSKRMAGFEMAAPQSRGTLKDNWFRSPDGKWHNPSADTD